MLRFSWKTLNWKTFNWKQKMNGCIKKKKAFFLLDNNSKCLNWTDYINCFEDWSVLSVSCAVYLVWQWMLASSMKWNIFSFATNNKDKLLFFFFFPPSCCWFYAPSPHSITVLKKTAAEACGNQSSVWNYLLSLRNLKFTCNAAPTDFIEMLEELQSRISSVPQSERLLSL